MAGLRESFPGKVKMVSPEYQASMELADSYPRGGQAGPWERSECQSFVWSTGAWSGGDVGRATAPDAEAVFKWVGVTWMIRTPIVLGDWAGTQALTED